MTAAITWPTIERPDTGIAVVTLTAPLDTDATADLRGTLVALTAEGRHHIALDLTDAHGATHTGIADLAHQAEKLRDAGGSLYLIAPGGGLAQMVKARAFANRGKWERYGGIAATPKPHPVRHATTEQVLRDADTHYGVPIITLGEEDEWAFTLGHHDPRRFLAALLAYVRTTCGCDPADVGLDSIDDLAAFGEKARDHRVIYTHADRVTVGEDVPGERAEDWCVCDEMGWYAAGAEADAPYAVPTMTYWIGG